MLENRFSSKIGDIFRELKPKRKLLKSNLDLNDGIDDSVNTCLIKFKSETFKNPINLLDVR